MLKKTGTADTWHKYITFEKLEEVFPLLPTYYKHMNIQANGDCNSMTLNLKLNGLLNVLSWKRLLYMYIKKVPLSLYLSIHWNICGNRDIAPFTFNLGTKWKWMVSLMLWSLYPRARTLCTHLNLSTYILKRFLAVYSHWATQGGYLAVVPGTAA
jgi:hypothetical protein